MGLVLLGSPLPSEVLRYRPVGDQQDLASVEDVPHLARKSIHWNIRFRTASIP